MYELREIGNLIDGREVRGPHIRDVLDKYSGSVFGRVYEADEAITQDGIATARRAADGEGLTPHKRYRILDAMAREILENRERIATAIARESGFTYNDCYGDATRAVETFRHAAQGALQLTGGAVPVQSAPGFENRLAFTIRVPVGVVCAITPFNSPLNTVAHKIAPAIAAGNAVILKPSTHTPFTAFALAQSLFRHGLPPDFLTIIFGGADPAAKTLLTDQRIDFYTFTGSTRVGKHIASHLGLRRANLELGNVSATVVCADADLEMAVAQVTRGAFRKAGQVCTSVQRLYVHESIIEGFANDLAAAAEALVVGNPLERTTDIGPMISKEAAERADEWVAEAVAGGARIMTSRTRQEHVFPPTVLIGVQAHDRVVCEEIFAPVVTLLPFNDLNATIDAINASPYGLQAGIFTQDIDRALTAAKRLNVGGVIINDTSSSRADLMPYGGVKDSGYGKEGPHHAMREMTNERLVMIDHRSGQGGLSQ